MRCLSILSKLTGADDFFRTRLHSAYTNNRNAY